MSSVIDVLLIVLVTTIYNSIQCSLSFLVNFVPRQVCVNKCRTASRAGYCLTFSKLRLVYVLLDGAVITGRLFHVLAATTLLNVSVVLSPVRTGGGPLDRGGQSDCGVITSILSSVSFLLTVFGILPCAHRMIYCCLSG